MKRMLLAAVLALGIHGFLLGMEFRDFRMEPTGGLRSPVLSMTLAYRHPRKAAEKPSVEKAEREPAKSVPPTKIPVTPPKAVVKPSQQEKTPVARIDRPTPTHGEPPPSEDLETPGGTDRPDEAFTEGDAGQGVAGGGLLREARPLYRVNQSPRYPGAARRRGHQGQVLLEVLVDRDGKVADLRIFKSSDYAILDNAAMESVQEWVFEPGMRGEERVEMWVRVPIRFELK